MDKQQIINNMRHLAEAEYHSRLKNIEAEIDERYHKYQLEVALIDEAERRCAAGFAAMREAAAARHGLVTESVNVVV